jgi:hypothetical protein
MGIAERGCEECSQPRSVIPNLVQGLWAELLLALTLGPWRSAGRSSAPWTFKHVQHDNPGIADQTLTAADSTA